VCMCMGGWVWCTNFCEAHGRLGSLVERSCAPRFRSRFGSSEVLKVLSPRCTRFRAYITLKECVQPASCSCHLKWFVCLLPCLASSPSRLALDSASFRLTNLSFHPVPSLQFTSPVSRSCLTFTQGVPRVAPRVSAPVVAPSELALRCVTSPPRVRLRVSPVRMGTRSVHSRLIYLGPKHLLQTRRHKVIDRTAQIFVVSGRRDVVPHNRSN
jgi:hypothetical protein